MAKVFEVYNNTINLVKEYAELNTCTDGMAYYFLEKGYSKGDVQEILDEGYWDGAYDKFILDFNGKRIIAED